MKRGTYLAGMVTMGLAGCLVAVAGTPAVAEYPTKSIKLIVPYKPGGGTDNMVRIIADVMGKHLPEKVVVMNIAGGGGTLGMHKAMQSKPDGHTVGLYNTNTHVAMATKVAPFKMSDFVPACMFADAILTITTKWGGGYDTLDQFVKAAKAKPNKLTWAVGQGTLAFFGALMANERLGIDVKLVHHGSGAEKKASVIGGHISALMDPIAGVAGQYRAKQLKVLAILDKNRLESFPDTPTGKEQGLDMSLAQSNGFFFPVGTPQDRIDTFCGALEKASQDAGYKARMKKLEASAQYRNQAETNSYMAGIAGEINRLAKASGY